MVKLTDLNNPSVRYAGQIFWDMLRPGVRLAVLGPQGCLTSLIEKVVELREGQWIIETRNSKYMLSRETAAGPRPLQRLTTLATA